MASSIRTDRPIRSSEVLRHVRYEIRGQLAQRAYELENSGDEIISLNIGNPATLIAFALQRCPIPTPSMLYSIALKTCLGQHS